MRATEPTHIRFEPLYQSQRAPSRYLLTLNDLSRLLQNVFERVIETEPFAGGLGQRGIRNGACQPESPGQFQSKAAIGKSTAMEAALARS